MAQATKKAERQLAAIPTLRERPTLERLRIVHEMLSLLSRSSGTLQVADLLDDDDTRFGLAAKLGIPVLALAVMTNTSDTPNFEHIEELQTWMTTEGVTRDDLARVEGF